MRLEVRLQPVRGDEHALGERVPRDDLALRALAREVAHVRAQLRHGDVAHERRDDGVELEPVQDLLHALDRLGGHRDERHGARGQRRRLPEAGEVEVERERGRGVDGDEGGGLGAVKEFRRAVVAEDGLLVIVIKVSDFLAYIR